MSSKRDIVHLLLRGAEAGGITKADIERRAQELALIRTGATGYSDEDLERAARELLGDAQPAAMTEDVDAEVAASRDPSETRSIRGHQREPSPTPPEENTDPERLAIQGVEEAQHDQMVRAQDRDLREERKERRRER